MGGISNPPTVAPVTKCDIEVFNGTTPAVPAWTDLDLSSVVGARAAFVILRATPAAGWTAGHYIITRPNGETEFSSTQASPFKTTFAATQAGILFGLTGSDGIIEWRAEDGSIDCVIDLLAYITNK